MKEIWKKIKGFDTYMISNHGRVMSLPKEREMPNGGVSMSSKKILSPVPNTSGHLHASLRKNGETHRRLVHRLVAQAFIPNPENKPHINHIDFNPKNNHVSNLEWCTPKENGIHSAKHGRLSFSHNKITAKQAREIKDKYKTGKYTQIQLGKEYGVTRANISLITRGKNWTWV